MPAERYIVELDADEREQLLELTSKGKLSVGGRPASGFYHDAMGIHSAVPQDETLRIVVRKPALASPEGRTRF